MRPKLGKFDESCNEWMAMRKVWYLVNVTVLSVRKELDAELSETKS
jgi:hypothetical protein